MATLYTHQSANITKTWILMLVFFVVVVGLGYWLGNTYHNPLFVFIAFIVSLTINIGSYWYSDAIALSTAGAKPAEGPEFVELHRTVENLAITAGIPKPRVYIIRDDAPNAFATGRNPEHSAIAVTTGLLDTLERSELEGVLAHEMAHIGNRDVLVMTVAVILAGFVAYVADFASRLTLFGGSDDDDRGGGMVKFLIVIVVSVLAQIGALLIQMAISRKREYLADATGSLITRYPAGLAGALQKISGYRGSVEHATTATAHLYIANPFGSGFRSRVSGLFSTHPPVEERIKRLNEMAM